MSSINVAVQATGVAFPQVTKFWQGETYRCVGAGVRTKKVAFVGVKVRPLSETWLRPQTLFLATTLLLTKTPLVAQ